MFRHSTRAFGRLATSPRNTSTNIIAYNPSRFALAPPRRPAGARFLASKSDDPPPKQPIDTKHERELAQQKLKSDPSKVSSQSSVRQFVAEAQPASPTGDQGDRDTTKDLRNDIATVKDTFRFNSVPQESRLLGLAGTLPYLGTSLSTIYLAWDMNQVWPSGNWVKDAIIMDHETARYLLGVIEPVQLGYGAVIISFLGAIHWGLEYAEKQPLRERTRFRYGMGLASSIIAWPTLFMPFDYALITQFMAFVGLYFADAKASTRGWAPHWYGTYRFLLTAMVGLAIFVSLVGRANISQGDTLTGQGLQRRISSRDGLADYDTDWVKLEKEEKARLRKKKAEDEKKEAEKKKQEEKKQKKSKDTGKASKESSDKSKAKDEKDKEGNKDDKKSAKKEGDKGDSSEETEKSEGKSEGKPDNEEEKGEEKDEEKDDKEDDKEDKEQDNDEAVDENKDEEQDEDKDNKSDDKESNNEKVNKDESKDKKNKN